MPPLSFVANIKMSTTRDRHQQAAFPLLFLNRCKLTLDLFGLATPLCCCGLASSGIERDRDLNGATGVCSPTGKENHVTLCVDLSKNPVCGLFLLWLLGFHTSSTKDNPNPYTPAAVSLGRHSYKNCWNSELNDNAVLKLITWNLFAEDNIIRMGARDKKNCCNMQRQISFWWMGTRACESVVVHIYHEKWMSSTSRD